MRAIKDLRLEHTRLLKTQGHVSTGPSLPSYQNKTSDQDRVIARGELFQACGTAQVSLNLPLFGQMTGTMTTLKHHSGIITYAFSVLLQLPFSRAFVSDIFLRRWSASWLYFRISRDSTLAVVKLVEDDSDFMVACKHGDVEIMRKMLHQGEATSNEITLDNRTPMWEAIESGTIQAVELLIHYGADINGLLGMRQTSPLVISIRRRDVKMVRLLLAHGACDHHVTALGWTPLFYLWSKSSSSLLAQPASSVVEILSPRPGFNYSHSNILHTLDYGLIHMAAIRGTAADIQVLVKSGVDPFSKTKRLQWQAAHFAVANGNLETFMALLSYYPSNEINSTDTQGWTFLHILAIMGHGHISLRLLELGVDLHSLTSANSLYAPDCLAYLEHVIYGRQWSALQLAALYGVERKAVFLHAVSCVFGANVLQGAGLLDLDSEPEGWVDAKAYNR